MAKTREKCCAVLLTFTVLSWIWMILMDIDLLYRNKDIVLALVGYWAEIQKWYLSCWIKKYILMFQERKRKSLETAQGHCLILYSWWLSEVGRSSLVLLIKVVVMEELLFNNLWENKTTQKHRLVNTCIWLLMWPSLVQLYLCDFRTLLNSKPLVMIRTVFDVHRFLLKTIFQMTLNVWQVENTLCCVLHYLP